MAHPCSQCDASFPVRMSMLNHKRIKHGDTKQFNCEKCVYTSDKKGNLEQHVRSVHKKVKETCETCGKDLSDKPNLNKHVKRLHTKTQVTKRKASDTLEIPTKRIKLDWLILHKISLFAFVRKYVSVFNEILPTFKRTSEGVTVSHFQFF